MAIGTVTVGVASTQFLPANALRSSLLLQNLSANDIYVNFGAAAVVGSGLRLVPNQAVPVLLNADTVGGYLSGSVNAIASAAGSKVWGVEASVV